MISESSKEKVQDKINLEVEKFFDRVNKILTEFEDEVTGEVVTPEEYDELDDDIIGLDALEWLKRLRKDNDKVRPYEPFKPYEEDTWPLKIWKKKKKVEPWTWPYEKPMKVVPDTVITPNYSCCTNCSNNPANGGSGICNCILPYMTTTTW